MNTILEKRTAIALGGDVAGKTQEINQFITNISKDINKLPPISTEDKGPVYKCNEYLNNYKYPTRVLSRFHRPAGADGDGLRDAEPVPAPRPRRGRGVLRRAQPRGLQPRPRQGGVRGGGARAAALHELHPDWCLKRRLNKGSQRFYNHGEGLY